METTEERLTALKKPAGSFNEIYQTYYKRAFLFAKSYVHNDMAAEDIASESLIKLWEVYKEKEVDYVEPLLLTILKNKALDHLKHQAVHQAAFEKIADWQQHELSIRISSLESCNPDEIFSKEIKDIVQQTLRKLPEQTRKIFIMSRFGNKMNKEIAEEMNLSVKSVEYHIGKALQALRVSLKDYLPLFYFFFYY